MSKYQTCLFFLVILAVLLAVLGNRFSFPPDQVRAQAVETLPEEKLDRKIDSFFRNLEQSIVPTNTAFEDLFQEGPQTPRTSPEAVKNMSEKFTELNSSGFVGRIHGWEKIETKPIGKDVIILTYLSKHDIAPVKWSFTFYRPPSRSTTPPIGITTTNADWNVIQVLFDTNLE